MTIKQTVVRSYSRDFTNTNKTLRSMLEYEGWTVKLATPFIKNHETEYIEYILEKECD